MTRRGRGAARTPSALSPSVARPPVGFDPLVAGRSRRSGLLPSFKAPPGGAPSFIFTSALEWQLALWLELHPAVVEYGRVDVHEDAARRLRIQPVTGMRLCEPVRYHFDGQVSHFLADAGARLDDGSPALFEAGLLKPKSSDEARAAFDAARAYLATEGGTFGLLLEGDLTRRWFVRSLWLHLWRFAYFGHEGLLADIDAAWRAARSPRQLISEFGHRDRPEIVTHAVMKVAGDALAAGRLRHDVNRADFDLDTVTRLRAPGEPPAVPGPLRVEPPSDGATGPRADGGDADADGWLNPEFLEPDEAAVLIARRAAMQQVDDGVPAARFAELFGVTARRVQQIRVEWKKRGDAALLPYGTANHRGSRLPKEVKTAVRGALRTAPRSTGSDIARDAAVAEACATTLGRVPRADRFDLYLDELRRTDPRFRPRPSGRGRVTEANAAGFTAIYGNRPGFIVEYDGERTNLLAQLLPGLPHTDPAQRLKAKDVATSCPLGEVHSLHAPDQGEQRRLLFRVARPKDDLVARAQSEHPWPLRCWPMVWAGDNAWINGAGMFLTNLPEMGVCVVFQPAKRPEAKGTIESGIGKDQKIHEDRQPNATGRAPGMAEGRLPARYAAEHGIGLADVEADALRMTIDGDLWGPNSRLRCRPIDAWRAGLRRFPVRTWEGPDWELVRRFRRSVGQHRMSDGRLSYNGRDYGMHWGGDPDTDPRNELPYPVRRSATGLNGRMLPCTVDDDDVRTLEAHDPETKLTVTLVCNRLGLEYGRPVSEFELDLEKALDKDLLADARRSREAAAADVLARANGRPRKPLVRKAARQRELTARALETRGTPGLPRARGPRRSPAAARQPAPPAAPPVFTPRPGSYPSPVIHHRPQRAPRDPNQRGQP